MKLRKDVEPIASDDFHYSLFQGYIRPEDFLVDPSEVIEAARIIDEFESLLEDHGLIEDY